eukprot:scaffold4049_cov204-Alexandrium_tamarense.AAC.52
MSLAAFAVIGRQGTPLYMRDFPSNLFFDIYSQPLDSSSDDFFGDSIQETTTKQQQQWPCSMKYQFMLHSACERMEEVLREGGWKIPGSGSSGVDACWVGLLCGIDGFNAYGYVTTNTRYIALVEDAIAPENVQLQKSRENDLKTLILIDIGTLWREEFVLGLSEY